MMMQPVLKQDTCSKCYFSTAKLRAPSVFRKKKKKLEALKIIESTTQRNLVSQVCSPLENGTPRSKHSKAKSHGFLSQDPLPSGPP